MPGLGSRLQLDAGALRLEADDGDAGHSVDPLVRRSDAAQGRGRPARQSEGHDGVRSRRQHRDPHARRRRKGIEKLELLVVADPHPTTWAVLSERKNDTYLLPICTQFECSGSRTASNRSIQWGEQIVKPIFESKNDYEVIYLLAKKLGLADLMFKNIKVENNRAVGRGSAARNQSRRLLDRLLRPVAGTPQGAHEEPGQVRPGFAACGQGYAGGRRRLLRPAVAVLGHAGDPASRYASALQHQPSREGRRRHVPGPFRRRDIRARRSWPRAPTRWVRNSRTAIRSSRWAC